MKKIAYAIFSLMLFALVGCDGDGSCMKVHHTSNASNGCNFVFDDGSVIGIWGGSCTDSYVLNASSNIGDGSKKLVWQRSYQTLEQCLEGRIAYKQAVEKAEDEYKEAEEKRKQEEKLAEEKRKRNEEEYKKATQNVVTIGKQVWMAKNLNVETDGSWCYDSKPENCEKYGRLYTWEAAQNACPAGWRLPSKKEFEKLIEFAGGSEKAQKALRSKTGWYEKGADTYGFSALPAGLCLSDGKEFIGVGDRAIFWSSTEDSGYNAYSLRIDDSRALVYDFGKYRAFSVRCLQD